MSACVLQSQLPLPAGFRVADVLAFHRRDSLQLAERTMEGEVSGLDKALVWDGHPACVEVRFHAMSVTARLTIDEATGGRAEDAAAHARFERFLKHMLGLDQPVNAFECAHVGHPELGPLIARNAGLRVPQAATPFEALTWAVLGQQVSLGAAVTLRRKLIEAAGCRHSGGLMCYPDAERVSRLDHAALRGVGCSRTKADALLALSREVLDGRLPLDEWAISLPIDEIRERLLAIRGIGPWTVNYALLRGFGWLDGALHGDAAVRRGLQHLLGSTERISERAAQDWLAPFSPWRALVAAHLWALKADA